MVPKRPSTDIHTSGSIVSTAKNQQNIVDYVQKKSPIAYSKPQTKLPSSYLARYMDMEDLIHKKPTAETNSTRCLSQQI